MFKWFWTIFSMGAPEKPEYARKCKLGTLYFTSPNEDETAISRGHPSHAKV